MLNLWNFQFFLAEIVIKTIDEAADEEYELTIDDEEYIVYVLETSEDEEYTFDDEEHFDVYSMDVSSLVNFILYQILDYSLKYLLVFL